MKIPTIALALLITGQLFAQQSETLVYKKIDTTSLKMEVLYPDDFVSGEARPTIIFFFGGGWVGGTTDQFRPQAEYLNTRGMIAVLADYRIKSRNGTTPFDALADAKSAMRFLRKNAGELGIAPNRIVASGGSAGGHLAAATAYSKGFDDPDDDLAISCVPNALVLFNPVIDNSPDGYGYERVGEKYQQFSPLHNINGGGPPAIFFLGDNDELIPVNTGREFKKRMEDAGNRCELRIYQNAGHGFFNPRNPGFYYSTLKETEKFLESLGYLDPAKSRPVKDTIGFAQYDWQMDSVLSRLNKRVGVMEDEKWKAVISPHDDYKYSGEVALEVLSGIKAKTVILFGVAHKASVFGLQDKIVFGSFSHWDAPYSKIPVSPLRDEILDQLPADSYVVHDSMMTVEHSLEALNPFLQIRNVGLEIIPILVPYMDYQKMDKISDQLSVIIDKIMNERGLEWGSDLAIVISSDAVHYGDKDWGGKNMAPLGSGEEGNEKAVEHEKEIISTSLTGPISEYKIKKFVNYTVQETDYHVYKWTWCGRYSIPLGLMTANKLNIRINKKPLEGTLVDYATSIDHEHYPVEDIGMGTTAPANENHWVGYAGIGYR
jgi:AmmeMemoRadiSam system protein B